MTNIDYQRRAKGVEDRPSSDAAMWYAGGTDLLPSIRSGLVEPDVLVELKDGDLPRGIEREEGRWRIGALSTLADLEDHAALAAEVPAVVEAAAQAATRQIRNRATVGGNLLQRSRCAYYRDPTVTCWLQGADSCPAREGLHQHHSVVDASPCITTHPSDLAGVLLALDAAVHTLGDVDAAGTAIDDLLRPPTADRRALHTLDPHDVIASVSFDAPAGGSVYLKAMDRAAWQFALVGVGVVRRADGVAVVANGIAPCPLRLTDVEDVLAGHGVDGDVLDEPVITAAVDAIGPFDALPGNRYKVSLLRGLVGRALGTFD